MLTGRLSWPMTFTCPSYCDMVDMHVCSPVRVYLFLSAHPSYIAAQALSLRVEHRSTPVAPPPYWQSGTLLHRNQECNDICTLANPLSDVRHARCARLVSLPVNLSTQEIRHAPGHRTAHPSACTWRQRQLLLLRLPPQPPDCLCPPSAATPI